MLIESPCEENELWCGGHKHQCVHHLLVCDDHTDCYNGYDEDTKLCSGFYIDFLLTESNPNSS